MRRGRAITVPLPGIVHLGLLLIAAGALVKGDLLGVRIAIHTDVGTSNVLTSGIVDWSSGTQVREPPVVRQHKVQ